MRSRRTPDAPTAPETRAMSYQFQSLQSAGQSIPALADANRFRQLLQRLRDSDAPHLRRALPLLDDNNYRNVQAYAQVYQIVRSTDSKKAPNKNWFERLFPRFLTAS